MHAHQARHKHRLFLWLLVIGLLSTILFGLSLWQRSPWFGRASMDMSGAMTAGTAGVAKHWYDEGFFPLRGALYWEPASIERPTPSDRTAYSSYPPGAVLPVYLLARLLHRPPSVALVMGWNLFNQWAIALALSLLVFFLLRDLGYLRLTELIFAGVPVHLYLWLPSPYWEHQMGYFADQAVLLPFVLFILIEVFRDDAASQKTERIWSAVQAGIAFWGACTDWFFFLVLACVFLKRIFHNGLATNLRGFLIKSLLFWLPALLALGLFLYQIHQLGALQDLWQRFTFQSGMEPRGFFRHRPQESLGFLDGLLLRTRFWKVFLPTAYGKMGVVLIFSSAAILATIFLVQVLRKLRGKAISQRLERASCVAIMLLMPCFLHSLIFSQHSAFLLHFFSVMKYAVPMAVIPFALVPATLLILFDPGVADRHMWRRSSSLRQAISLFLAPLMLLLASIYVMSLHPQRVQMYGATQYRYEKLGAFLKEHTDYKDIVVSLEKTIPRHYLILSGKEMHRIRTGEALARLLSEVDGPYVINCFASRPGEWEEHPDFRGLIGYAESICHEAEFSLYKIPRERLEEYYRVKAVDLVD